MRALILSNGKPPEKQLIEKYWRESQLTVAVDGAVHYLKRYALLPDLLVGDLDSSPAGTEQEFAQKGVEIVKLNPVKDDTDTLSALKIAIERGAKQIVLLGGMGSRMDHTLANIALCLYAANRGVEMTLADEKNIISLRRGEVRLTGRPGDILSLLPLSDGVALDRSRGLKYPLDHLALKMEYPVGVSNELTEQTASFEIRGGWALVMRSED